jgi:hypothetical protein
MSGLGMLAAAIGGASNAIGQQAAGDIEQKRKLDIAAETAAIEEQMRMRLAENTERLRVAGRTTDFAFDNDPTNVATRQATAKSNTLAQGAATREAAVAASGDAAYQGAQDAEASRAGARERTKTTEAAADPIYMGAITKIKLADPEVAARIAASRAQVAEAGARAGMLAQQTEGVRMDNADKKRLGKLYDDASSVLSDAALDDATRAKKFATITREITLLKSKNGAGGAVDKELDTNTVEETTILPDGSTRKVTSKEVRKPGAPGAAGGSGPAVGQEVNGFVFKGGDPNDKANWTKKGDTPPAMSTGTLKQGGVVDRVKDAAAGFIGDARKEGDVVNALRQKVQDGTPLTPEEKALARKYGMTP